MKLFRKGRILYKPQNSGRIVTFHQFALTFQQYAIFKIFLQQVAQKKEKRGRIKESCCCKKEEKEAEVEKKGTSPTELT